MLGGSDGMPISVSLRGGDGKTIETIGDPRGLLWKLLPNNPDAPLTR
jgi:hypothetical protein